MKKSKFLVFMVLLALLSNCVPSVSIFNLYNNGIEAYKDKQYEDAIQYYTMGIELAPENANLYVCRGMAYYDLEKYDSAISDFTAALNVMPNYIIAFYHRGQSYYAIGDYEHAVNDFNRVIERLPVTYAITYYQRANCYYNLRRYDNAIKDYSTAIKNSPHEGDYYYSRGISYLSVSDFDNALSDFTEAIRIYELKVEDEQLACAYYRRGKLYYEMGNNISAREDLEKACRLEPQGEFVKDARKILNRLIDKTPPEIIITSPEVSFRGIALVYPEREEKVVIIVGKALDESGISYVKVNGKLIELKFIPGGSEFETELLLEWGDNKINIKAEDNAGNVGSYDFIVRISEFYEPSKRYKRIQKWAVVVGISEYKYAQKGIPKLRYADLDAKAFYDFLRSPQGGGFIADHTRLLLNEEATTQNIREALCDFLKQPIEEDLVVIYFACHGAPESGNPDNLYLITYDTDPTKMPSTAFPMWEVDNALKRHIRSQRIILIADVCHSAGVFDVLAMRDLSTNLINKYMSALEEAGMGIAVLTSSETGEQSQESQKWGGGHGVFTYSLLEGLRGEADFDGNGIVTFGEITIYVSERVRRETNSTQHPTTSGTFDANLPMGVVK